MKLYHLLAVPALTSTLLGAAMFTAAGAASADEFSQVQRSVCMNGSCTTTDSDETGAAIQAAMPADAQPLFSKQAWQQARLEARQAWLHERLGRLQALSAQGGPKNDVQSSGYGDPGGFNLNIAIGNQEVEQKCAPRTKQTNTFASDFKQKVYGKRWAKWLKEYEVNAAAAQALNANQINQDQSSCQQAVNAQTAFGIIAAIDQTQNTVNVTNTTTQSQTADQSAAAAAAASADTENAAQASAAVAN